MALIYVTKCKLDTYDNGTYLKNGMFLFFSRITKLHEI